MENFPWNSMGLFHTKSHLCNSLWQEIGPPLTKDGKISLALKVLKNFCKNCISGDQKDSLLKKIYPSETQYLSYSVNDL